MTPKQKRIAIAEACGWTNIYMPQSKWQAPDYPGTKPDKSGREQLPDYLNDLNAMHEAEKVLIEPQFQTYLDWLDVSCGSELELSAMIDGPAFVFSIVHATASQRADAFLLTIGKL